MNGFHIDMNMVQLTRPCLERWLRELARLGYDTILWEVENNVQWETCPECVSPDAFSKAEFKDLLNLCSSLGLESIPLFQVLGHCEYVLKHQRYTHLAEWSDRIDQYCPRHPALIPFLTRWIQEYLDVFGPVRQFHLGGDEAWTLGSCDRCRSFLKDSSLSDLYIDHINTVSAPLLARDVRPAIWADMVLHYPQALDKLSRKTVMYDWMYDIYQNRGEIYVWGKGFKRKEELDTETLTIYGDFLFPDGDEPGREPEPFYTADFLAARGFDVVTCPASSSYGDNVFTPRHYYHLKNTFDSFQKGRQPHLKGSLLTSWTVHLFSYDLQLACMSVPAYLQANPDRSIDTYPRWFVEQWFQTDDDRFFRACGLLSKSCLFTYTASLGYSKSCLPTPLDHVQKTLTRLADEGKLTGELENCQARLGEYIEGLKQLQEFTARARKGADILACWNLSARNLIHRARSGEFLLKHQLAKTTGIPLNSTFKEQGILLLQELRKLRQETQKRYEPIIKPSRLAEIMDWIYASLEHALVNLIEP